MEPSLRLPATHEQASVGPNEFEYWPLAFPPNLLAV